MPVSMSGSWNISGSVAMDPVAPFSVSPGPTSSLLALQNQPIVNFNPLTVTGGYTPYTYFVSSGVIPPGLTLNPTTGVVSGSPTTVQNTASVVFAVRDSSGNQSGTTATINFAVQTLPVSAIPGTTTSVTSLRNVSITSFSPFSSVSNGFAPYVYSVSSGTLPTGITLDSNTGIVSGTPTVAGAATVVFAVRDSQNNQSPTTATVSFSVNSLTFTIQYLVVGGGGAGGTSPNLGFAGGGGGAGGLLAGSIINVTSGTPFVINVGTGGVAAANSTNGLSSNISSPVTPTITVVGGGAGHGQGQNAPPGGRPGGSGGGAYWNFPAGTGTPGQGFPGGNPTASQPSALASGGGGAGSAGSIGTCGGGLGTGGSGGTAYTWPFTGNTYAGGGGGGGSTFAGLGGGTSTTALKGGGGNGGSPGATPGIPGTASTGGGGGGANYQSPAERLGGNGGSGVVILAIPTPNYPGVAPGATVTTPPAAPGNTILTYATPSPTTVGSFTYTA